MRVKMVPMPNPRKPGTSGIDRVCEAYVKHLPQFGVDFVDHESQDFDLLSVHISCPEPGRIQVPIVQHLHGLHWSADYECDLWQLQVNAQIVNTLRYAKEVTVPSKWVSETIQRDMRFSPHVVPHGIDWQEWDHNNPRGNYVLYNKNREGDVCSSLPVIELARRFQNGEFVTTFLPRNSAKYNNVDVIGLVPHVEMKKLVQSAAVYLSTSKETFGIGVLEAMASGIPVLGFAYGGNIDLVQHGVNGYLAQPGDYDDLAEGLDYCIRYRDTLGSNGREMAKTWTWEKACEQVAKIYEMALQEKPATAAIVIPMFNKTAEQLGRAIDSACTQTYSQLTQIIVVDDGSDDPNIAASAVSERSVQDGRVRLVRKENGGVATARNHGIYEAGRVRYVSCLDADDAIEPEFITECVRELEADRSLGIAYTKILAITPDGESGVSQWPEEFDYDRQLKKQNQIPTACVFRREMWERLGGYNPKYCGPGGAGAEDGEYWLRAGAFGWGAKMASRRPLFIYSLGTGIVSGDPNYVEPDWTELWPWAGKDGDGIHPFASVATPKRFSHLVRQYDEPVVSVIIPVGPGHEEKVRAALDSLEHQTMRKWEAIVVWDGIGFSENDAPGKLKTAYPYARQMTMSAYNTTPSGPGWARNFGVKIARAPFLVFLDADDWLYPKCLERMLEEWNERQSIIYTDYVGKTYIDNPADLDPVLQERMYYYDEKNQEAVIGYRAAEYECDVAQEQPKVDVNGNIYVWTNVTSLVPKAWHNEIGGFDEQMRSWEDIDYHWRLARAGKCYARIPEELMVYQFHTGHRRERGRQEYRDLLYYIENKYKEIETMACSGCGGKRRSNPAPSKAPAAAAAALDNQMVLCKYIHPSRGDHLVVGGAKFSQPPPDMPTRRIGGVYHIDYGYRPGGGQAEFYVHRDDIALSPSLFMPIQKKVAVAIPVEEKEPERPPEAIVPPEDILIDEPIPRIPLTTEPAVAIVQPEPPGPLPRGAFPPPQAVLAGAPNIELEPMAGLSKATLSAIDESEETDTGPIFDGVRSITGVPPRPFDLQTLPGIGPATAASLKGNGITTKEGVLALGVTLLAEYRGIGDVKAEMIIEAIKGLG